MNLKSSSKLEGLNVALIFSHGNLAVDYNAGLIRGVEKGLLALGANVNTFTSAYFKNEIHARYAGATDPEAVVFPEDSPLICSTIHFFEEYRLKYDIIIGYFYDSILTPNTKITLKKYGKKLINFPLNLQDQPFLFSDSLSFFDETWCAEESVIELLRSQFGDKIRYVPMASDPSLYRPLVSPDAPRALFVGSAYGSRLSLLSNAARVLPIVASGIGYGRKSVLRQGVKHLTLGNFSLGFRVLQDWLLFPKVDIFRGGLSDEGFVKMASECGASLGFNDVRMPNGETGFKVRLREYESTMCGLCHLAQRLPELERHFEDRKEILLYDNEEELMALLQSIASGDIDWRSIGKAARARSRSDHSWASRLALALD